MLKKPNEYVPESGTGDGGRTIDDKKVPPPTTDTAGYGMIGVAVLAALYLGTMSKTPVRRRTAVKK